MPQGIILAAGKASRIGSNKMLLKHRGRFLIEHAIASMRPNVSKIIIVTGYYHDSIQAMFEQDSFIKVVKNELYELGMFSSIKAGLAYIDDDVYILPGDCPFVSEQTYEVLLQTNGDFSVPSYKRRHGHPVLIQKPLIKLLKEEPITSTLKIFRDRVGFSSVPVLDEGILIDIDTLEDVRAMNEQN